MNKKLVGLAVAATLSLTAFAASAEDMFRDAWYAVPSVNYMNTDGDLKASDGWGAGIKLGKELSPSWDLQGGLGYNRAGEDTGIAGAGGSYKQTTLGLDALYMFSRSNFRPFVLAGVGAARNKLGYDYVGAAGRSSKTSWLGNIGLGAQYLFNDTFGLQADLREQWSDAPTGRTALGAADDSSTVANTLLNLGGIFRFGAPAPVVAAAAPEPAPEACKPTMDTITVGAEKLFGYDKANLQAAGKAALDEAAAKIKANPEIKAVIVTGHTDRIGSDKYNQKLSERRAKQVADYLVAQGVDRSTITSSGKGESEPVVQCAGTKATKKLISCLAPNRRVTIQAEGQKETGCN
jgi:OmpA-OmpF porin, OOP family